MNNEKVFTIIFYDYALKDNLVELSRHNIDIIELSKLSLSSGSNCYVLKYKADPGYSLYLNGTIAC